MKKLLVILVLVFFTGLINAQYWTPMELPDLSSKWTITGIDFPTPETGFAVGFDYTDVDFLKAVVKGIILEFREGKWTKAVYPEVSDNWQLNGIFFLNDKEGYATGIDKKANAGIVMHYKNGAWEKISLPSPAFGQWILYDAYFVNENDGWVYGGSYGKDGPVLFRFLNGTWELVKSPEFSTQTIMAVTDIGPADVLAGGFREGDLSGIMQVNKAYGSYVARSKTDWAKEKLPLLCGNVVCMKLGKIAADDIFAAGYMPEFNNVPRTGKMMHFDGKKWEEIKLPDVAREWILHGVDFSGPDFGFAVGSNWTKNAGVILRYKKGEWETLDKKSEPQVSENWFLRDVCYDGKSSWYAAGSDETGNKGIILQLK